MVVALLVVWSLMVLGCGGEGGGGLVPLCQKITTRKRRGENKVKGGGGVGGSQFHLCYFFLVSMCGFFLSFFFFLFETTYMSSAAAGDGENERETERQLERPRIPQNQKKNIKRMYIHANQIKKILHLSTFIPSAYIINTKLYETPTSGWGGGGVNRKASENEKKNDDEVDSVCVCGVFFFWHTWFHTHCFNHQLIDTFCSPSLSLSLCLSLNFRFSSSPPSPARLNLIDLNTANLADASLPGTPGVCCEKGRTSHRHLPRSRAEARPGRPCPATDVW